MKKMKFTTGLILSVILLLVSNVVNAEKVLYDNSLPYSAHEHDIAISIKVNVNPIYVYDFNLLAIGYRIKGNTGSIFTSVPGPIDYQFFDSSLDDWIYNTSRSYSDLFKADFISIYHYNSIDFDLVFNYKDGKDLVPIIKRTVVLGEWYCEIDKDGNKTNKIDKTDIELLHYFTPSSTELIEDKYDFDRKTGEARYVYDENLNALAEKYPIFSISYEISLVDEFDKFDPSIPYGPPTMIEPEIMRSLTFDIEGSGITTNIPINLKGNALLVPSFKDYLFTVTSPENITITTNRYGTYSTDGVQVKKQAGSANKYDVIIKKVQSNFNVKIISDSEIQSSAGEDGTTGNIGPDGNAVWSSGGILNVKTATPGQLSIFTINGQLYKTVDISGNYSLPMPKGMYIVKFNGIVYKVAIL